MRAREIVIFLAGFTAGIVFLAVLLWQTHSLERIHAPSAPPARPASPAPGLPDTTRSPAPAPAPNTPPVAQTGLLMPVEGVVPAGLRDNFREMRNGHPHEALDIPAPRGTPVLAVAEGNVAKLFRSKPGGLTVYQFDDGQNWCFYYAHLDHYAKGLTAGALLRKGDVLGYVGTTGDAPPDAPHLHFAIFKLGPAKRWWEGTLVDPYPFLAGHAAWPPNP